MHDRPATSAFTDDRDVFSVATEKVRVFRGPFNGQPLII